MARKKAIVGDLEVKGKKYTCSRWQVWPPKEAFLFDGRSSQEARGEMSIDQYNRLHGWEIACGLLAMQEEKCPTCPYVCIDGKPLKSTIPNRATHSTESRRQMRIKREQNL